MAKKFAIEDFDKQMENIRKRHREGQSPTLADRLRSIRKSVKRTPGI